MNDLRTFGRDQTQQLEEFRGSEQAQLFARLVQTQCLLDLAKLPGLHTDLPSYAEPSGRDHHAVHSEQVLFGSDNRPGCPTDIDGAGPDGRKPAGRPRPLICDGEVVGELAVVPEVEPLCPPDFTALLAEQVSASLGSLVEAERLRRQAAVSQTLHFIELVSDQPTPEDLSHLVSALASLPNALGASLEIAHMALGGSVELAAGDPPSDPRNRSKSAVERSASRSGGRRPIFRVTPRSSPRS